MVINLLPFLKGALKGKAVEEATKYGVRVGKNVPQEYKNYKKRRRHWWQVWRKRWRLSDALGRVLKG